MDLAASLAMQRAENALGRKQLNAVPAYPGLNMLLKTDATPATALPAPPARGRKPFLICASTAHLTA
jgi:hypothetical protein